MRGEKCKLNHDLPFFEYLRIIIMENEELSPFSIDKDKAFEVIIDMLIIISARQRALEEHVFHKDTKTKEEFKEVVSDLDKSILFHTTEVYKYLFSRFSDLKDMLPPNVHQSKD
jgi:hypothetical protein